MFLDRVCLENSRLKFGVTLWTRHWIWTGFEVIMLTCSFDDINQWHRVVLVL